MPRKSDKRERLIDAANQLIHRHGFHKTTLADIASESGVPLGNVYYYFKTKEELCDAVIAERKKELTSTLNGCCRKTKDPRSALLRLVKSMQEASGEIAEAGCPHGRLCTELSNEIIGLNNSADDCLKVLLEWSRDQFRALGYRNAKDMGFEFVARIQGIILVGNSLHDEKQIRSQLRALAGWIESLEDRSDDGQAAA